MPHFLYFKIISSDIVTYLQVLTKRHIIINYVVHYHSSLLVSLLFVFDNFIFCFDFSRATGHRIGIYKVCIFYQ